MTQNAQVSRKPVSVGNYLNFPQTQKFLEANLKDKRGEFVSNLIAMVDGDSKLAECDPGTLMKCAMNATSLNLPLNKNLGFAYVIPYKGVPSFQIGYKGLIQLAIRTGQYEFLNACEIREGEMKRNKITGEINFIGEQPENKIVGYLAYLKLKTGFQASIYMTEAEIEAHAVRFSQMYKSDKKYGKKISKWSDPDARPKMALKTVIKSLLGTWGVMTTEMTKAMELDNSEQESATGPRSFEEAEVVNQDEPKGEAEKAKEPKTIQI